MITANELKARRLSEEFVDEFVSVSARLHLRCPVIHLRSTATLPLELLAAEMTIRLVNLAVENVRVTIGEGGTECNGQAYLIDVDYFWSRSD